MNERAAARSNLVSIIVETEVMKNPYRKINRSPLSLGELVEIVGSCARDSAETVAAVADLIATGRVSVCEQGTRKQLRLARAS